MKTVLLGLAAPALAALVALATGCGGGASATPTGQPQASGAVPGTVLGAPALAFDKLEADLGTVARDGQTTATFLVINKGDRPLQAGPVSIQVEEGCNAAQTVGEGAAVQPGEIVLLPIRLGPHLETGPHRLWVWVSSNDPARPRAAVSLRFQVAEVQPSATSGPRLRVDKETIDIGTVPFDWPLYEQFTLHNEGDAPLVLQGGPAVQVEEGC